MNIGPKNRLDGGGTLPMTRRIATAIPLQAQAMITQDRMKV
jgi:hypothetical protein